MNSNIDSYLKEYITENILEDFIKTNFERKSNFLKSDYKIDNNIKFYNNPNAANQSNFQVDNKMSRSKENTPIDLSGGRLYDGIPHIRNFRNKKWKCNQKTIDYSLNNHEIENFFEANNLVDSFFQEIYDENIRDINQNYFVQYVLDHDSFKNPIRSFYMRRKDFNSHSIMQNEFESVMQSRKKSEEFQTNNRFRVIFNIIENKQIQGGSSKTKKICK
jgi:hypothetical protein